MDSVIVMFPGSNREKDMADAIERVSGHRPRYVFHKDSALGSPDLIILPGGFSYGDYLRCGAIAAHSPIMHDIIKRANAGTPLFAVCNGFQILTETRLLPGTLLKNASLQFISRKVNIRLDGTSPIFTSKMKKGDIINVPVAHADGNYYVDDNTLKRLNDNDQVAFRYCDTSGNNLCLNGAVEQIAGVYNDKKTILGMMPHPENACDPVLGNASATHLIESLLR